ncbi:hypothetical protein N7486_006108 [Penicillium sp. IBT 16267x]|nr:hypothetical protein N7486_006108 [Penicillium sp. IBT 16267x]
MRYRLYQALLGGVAIVMGLVFLGTKLVTYYTYYNPWNDDLGLSIFNGKLPTIPQYDRIAEPAHGPLIPGTQIPDPVQDASTEKITSEHPASTSTAAPTGSSGSFQEFDPEWNNKSTWPQWSKHHKAANLSQATPTNRISHERIDRHVHSILDFRDNWPFERVSCPANIVDRYQMLRDTDDNGQVRYFFALNPYEALDALPRLMSSIIETVKYLGAKHCAISIVDGGSEDGTWEVLAALKPFLDNMGVQYFLATSDPTFVGDDTNRETPANLRNQALQPLKTKEVEHLDALAGMYSPEAVVIFLDDIAMCPEDILELVFQHVNQKAQMTCAFDWIFKGTVFHDVWESRSLAGNTFFEIPPDGSLADSDDMFFDNQTNKRRYDNFQPLQVYSCWGGMVTLNAVSFAENIVRFRPAEQTDADCYMGEPMLLADDLFSQGLGKILAVPSVNVAYSDNEATETKHTRGYVSDHVNTSRESLYEDEMVQWQIAPPDMIKCLAHSDQLAWTEWTEST